MKKHSLSSEFYPHIDNAEFTYVTQKLREFFTNKGFLEVHTQNRLSILAACEDPFNIGTFHYENKNWPLPQTGQMWLEHELLNSDKNESANGWFCLSTSYRNEKNPVSGRHCKIFPMFEFESYGDIFDLQKLESELLEFLGFGKPYIIFYEDACLEFDTDIITGDHETELYKKYGHNISLQYFPERTNPFWNMERNDYGIANKIDVLLYGQETIGSAQRSCDKDLMRKTFFTIENGKYSEKIIDLFGYDRVISELNEFLQNDFVPRYGAGIGVTRLIRAMKLHKLI